jgi:plasmid stabilization system protein ParE
VTRLVWTRPALEDVQQLHDHIARDSPRYARAVAE